MSPNMDSARSSSGLFLVCDNLSGTHQSPPPLPAARPRLPGGIDKSPPLADIVMHAHLRIARPVADLARTEHMYRDAFEPAVLARFDDHDGFSGVILGREGLDYHFEFTHCPAHPVAPSPPRRPDRLLSSRPPGMGSRVRTRSRARLHAGDIVQSILECVRTDVRGRRRLPHRAAEREAALTAACPGRVTRRRSHPDERELRARQTPHAVAAHAPAATQDARNRASVAAPSRVAAQHAAIAGWQQPSMQRSRRAPRGRTRRPIPQRPLPRHGHAPTMCGPGAT